MNQFSRSLFFPVESVMFSVQQREVTEENTKSYSTRTEITNNNKAINNLFNITNFLCATKYLVHNGVNFGSTVLLIHSFPLCRCRLSVVRRQNEGLFHFQLLCAPKINTIENKQFNWMKSSEFQTEKQMYKIFGAHKTQKTKGSNSGCG